jgi:hypothetical protein
MGEPAFSVCTLVTDPSQHAAMRDSFAAHGFGAAHAEFLTVDNTAGNTRCAYRGLDDMLASARGRYAILCHQDVRLIGDGAPELEAALEALTARDPAWALAGNAGATEDGALAIRISDPHGEDQRRGTLPARVASLDENFLVVRAEAGIRPSQELSGFHFYGTDLCLRARQAGRTAWVVDFHLRHLSAGRVDAGFRAEQARFERHWGARVARPMRLRTTCAKLDLGSGIGWRLRTGWRRLRAGF